MLKEQAREIGSWDEFDKLIYYVCRICGLEFDPQWQLIWERIWCGSRFEPHQGQVHAKVSWYTVFTDSLSLSTKSRSQAISLFVFNSISLFVIYMNYYFVSFYFIVLKPCNVPRFETE